MKLIIIINASILTLIVLSVQPIYPQGFLNLDFESAKIISDPGSPYYPYGIATSNALPGWIVTGYGSTNPASSITFNDPALGSSWATLWATNGQQISGKYSVLLQGGIGTGVSISQTATLPLSVYSILFEAQPGYGLLELSLGGQILPFSPIGSGSNYTLYGANIPAGMNGQIEQVIFSAIGYNGGGGVNNWNIDNIQFSSSTVPEPGVWGLAGLGALTIGLRRRAKGWRIKMGTHRPEAMLTN